MRWVALLVAETHRILARGAVFLYPRDDRPDYKNGRLRMVYECAPVAMLIEQAGGKATDGQDAIMAQTAPDLHARTPLVFGSADMVDRVATYHDLPENEVSALFAAAACSEPEGPRHEQKTPDHFCHRLIRGGHDNGQNHV